MFSNVRKMINSHEPSFARVGSLLRDAVTRGAFPCAALEVGSRDTVAFADAWGALTYGPDAPAATLDTVFDLASLTKAIATTTVLMRLVDQGDVELSAPVSHWLHEWSAEDRKSVTVADLLEHTSGLTAHLPFFRDHVGRGDFQHSIGTLPLEYTPRTSSIYSDLGFILLGFLAVDAAQGNTLDSQFDTIVAPLGLGDLQFRPPSAWNSRTAPTERDGWRGRLLQGEVHDENGWALGGVAGHTGLFGTTPAVGRFARAVLTTLAGSPLLAEPRTMMRFLQRSSVAGSSRALGWDTMLVTSSCGHKLSAESIGHTGFTGTSLWLDPTQDLYVVLLTNRVHPTRDNEAILDLRPMIHDAVVEAMSG